MALYPKYGKNEFSARVRASLHEDVGGYITLLESEPFVRYPGLAYSIDESVDFMIEMEKTLLTSQIYDIDSSYLTSTYISLLNELIIGSKQGRIVGRDGKVKEEYRKAWKRIASIGEDSPSAFIMRKVMDEMEASDWKESASYGRLDTQQLYRAMEFAREDNLSSFELNEFSNQFGRITVSRSDPDYISSVEGAYEKFSKNHDSTILHGANPLIVLGVYYYANELNDPVTMWHLYNHEYIPISLEDYVENWTKEETVFDRTETLFYEMGMGTINGAPHVPIGYEEGNVTSNFAWMLLDEESSIWTFSGIPTHIETR